MERIETRKNEENRERIEITWSWNEKKSNRAILWVDRSDLDRSFGIRSFKPGGTVVIRSAFWVDRSISKWKKFWIEKSRPWEVVGSWSGETDISIYLHFWRDLKETNLSLDILLRKAKIWWLGFNFGNEGRGVGNRWPNFFNLCVICLFICRCEGCGQPIREDCASHKNSNGN